MPTRTTSAEGLAGAPRPAHVLERSGGAAGARCSRPPRPQPRRSRATAAAERKQCQRSTGTHDGGATLCRSRPGRTADRRQRHSGAGVLRRWPVLERGFSRGVGHLPALADAGAQHLLLGDDVFASVRPVFGRCSTISRRGVRNRRRRGSDFRTGASAQFHPSLLCASFHCSSSTCGPSQEPSWRARRLRLFGSIPSAAAVRLTDRPCSSNWRCR